MQSETHLPFASLHQLVRPILARAGELPTRQRVALLSAGANPLVVLNEDFQSAFLACAVLAAIGVALALLLLGRPRKAPQERLEPAPPRF